MCIVLLALIFDFAFIAHSSSLTLPSAKAKRLIPLRSCAQD
jgi:hypothetical protein